MQYLKWLDEKKQNGSLRSLRNIDAEQRNRQKAGAPFINLSSNDYLSFGDDAALRQQFWAEQDVASLRMIYGFNNPESLRMRIDKAVPCKTEDGDLGVMYFVRVGDRDSADDADSDRLYQVAYVNGDIASFDPVADDAADLAVLKVCGKTQ